MSNPTPTPTTLEIYYCENCHGIIASTDLSKLDLESEYTCPFCNEDSLVLLPKEIYQVSFNPDVFPFNQGILLQTFFSYADNLVALLGVFSSVGIFSLLPKQIEVMPPLENAHIFFTPELIATVQLDGADEHRTTITSDQIHDITPLITGV